MRQVWIAVIAGAAGWGAPPALAQDITGTWLTETQTSRVRIAPCGAARCGTIVWVQNDTKDVNNPDPERRARSLVGLRMISDLKRDGESWSGSLYNPLDGRTYAGKFKLKSTREAELSGCVLGGLVCRSQTWSKVD
jgi:uncharacterized protein (DUF2147 family)